MTYLDGLEATGGFDLPAFLILYLELIEKRTGAEEPDPKNVLPVLSFAIRWSFG